MSGAQCTALMPCVTPRARLLSVTLIKALVKCDKLNFATPLVKTDKAFNVYRKSLTAKGAP